LIESISRPNPNLIKLSAKIHKESRKLLNQTVNQKIEECSEDELIVKNKKSSDANILNEK